MSSQSPRRPFLGVGRRRLSCAGACATLWISLAALAHGADSGDFPAVYQEPKDPNSSSSPATEPSKDVAASPAAEVPSPKAMDPPPLVEVEKGNIILLHPFGDQGDPAGINPATRKPSRRNSDSQDPPSFPKNDSAAMPERGYYRYSIDCPTSMKGVPPLNAPGCETFVHAVSPGEHLTAEAVRCIRATVAEPYKAAFSTDCRMVEVDICGADAEACSKMGH